MDIDDGEFISDSAVERKEAMDEKVIEPGSDPEEFISIGDEEAFRCS